MNIKSVFSTKHGVQEAVEDIKNQLNGFETGMLIFFASSAYNPESISKQMQGAFSSSIVFGCTTAGEIVSGHMLKNSLAVMAFTPSAMEDIKVEVVENIKQYGSIDNVFRSFEDHFGKPMSEMDFRKYIGIILIDGLSAAEEKIMDRIGDKTNLIFIGGSAGDDIKFERTYVYANGRSYQDAAILAVLKPSAGFDIIKTQSFKNLNKKLTATKVNIDTREVIEFNNEPAAKAYAKLLGVNIEDAENYFMTNPVGLIVEDEIFVRSPQKINGDNIVFYCNILEGMEVSLLESTDIIEDTKKIVQSKIKDMGTISGMINFHCILRTLELEKKGRTYDYGKIFEGIEAVGFSTYGEEYIGHINQTSTILVFR